MISGATVQFRRFQTVLGCLGDFDGLDYFLGEFFFWAGVDRNDAQFLFLNHLQLESYCWFVNASSGGPTIV